jgi:hypothetical protein
VRDLQRRRCERHDPARQQPQPAIAAQLGRGVEQQLHPQAQPEDRRPLARALDHELVEAELAHRAHRGGEGAHAGDDEPVGGAQRVVVGGQRDARADALERLLDAATVAHPVVDDADRGHVSVPLVDGTPVSSGRARPPRAARGRTP